MPASGRQARVSRMHGTGTCTTISHRCSGTSTIMRLGLASVALGTNLTICQFDNLSRCPVGQWDINTAYGGRNFF